MTLDLGSEAAPPLAVLCALQTPDETDGALKNSLDELERLCTTLGLQAVARAWQKRKAPDAGSVLGEGKVQELRALLAELETPEWQVASQAIGPDQSPREVVLVFNDGLSPSQTRNLSEAVGAPVLDRNTVILEIFHRHARTPLARTQVEMVRLEYQAPRLRSGVQRADRAGGIGASGKGKGESHLELDRRRIRDRIAALRLELARIERNQELKRRGRIDAQVAVVGYTNAGKSTLMRALTGSDVYVADKLFATLETRVRQILPPTRPPILLSDTVGFIKRLPHGLISSFKATLDEALDAALLLHVVDASSPDWSGELQTTLQVLAEIGADTIPRLLLFNKIDRLTLAELAPLQQEFPQALLLSALDPAAIASLHTTLEHYFQQDMEERCYALPFTQHSLVSFLHEHAVVLEERHEDAGTSLRVRAPGAFFERFEGRLRGSTGASSLEDQD